MSNPRNVAVSRLRRLGTAVSFAALLGTTLGCDERLPPGTTSAPTPLTVAPRPFNPDDISLIASPTTITSGGRLTLSWQAQSGGVAVEAATGSRYSRQETGTILGRQTGIPTSGSNICVGPLPARRHSARRLSRASTNFDIWSETPRSHEATPWRSMLLRLGGPGFKPRNRSNCRVHGDSWYHPQRDPFSITYDTIPVSAGGPRQ